MGGFIAVVACLVLAVFRNLDRHMVARFEEVGQESARDSLLSRLTDPSITESSLARPAISVSSDNLLSKPYTSAIEVL